MSETTEFTLLIPDHVIPDDVLQHIFEQLIYAASTDKERNQLLKGFAALGDGYTITESGMLKVQGSSGTYHVDGSFCYRTNVLKKNGKHGDVACQGFLRSGGNCYHVFAYQIVLAAQQALLKE